MKPFASDNNSGVHPQVFEAMLSVNKGSCSAYGNDQWTAQAKELFKDAFGDHAQPYFVMTGTAANILGLRSVMKHYECIVCPSSSHISTDETGALEAVAGRKLLFAPSVDGKIFADSLPRFAAERGNIHTTYPKVVSIAQLTEFGTAYTIDEIHAIGKHCKENGWYFHMDGARLANAAVHLNASLQELTKYVDLLSFGGAKNGLMNAESIVFLNQELGESFGYYQKQGMQLCSKARFLAAQFIAYFTDDLWRKNAQHANAMARILADNIKNLEHVSIVYSVDGNAVFARMPKAVVDRLAQEYYFYIIDHQDDPNHPEGWPMVRFMTAFDTTEQAVMDFVHAVKSSAV